MNRIFSTTKETNSEEEEEEKGQKLKKSVKCREISQKLKKRDEAQENSPKTEGNQRNAENKEIFPKIKGTEKVKTNYRYIESGGIS